MISGMKNSPVAPVKWWNLKPTSSASSRNKGTVEGTLLAVFHGHVACPASPKESNVKKSYRPRVRPPFVALTVDFRALRHCGDHARCLQGVRPALVLQHDRAPHVDRAGHSGGHQNVRARRPERKRIAGCPGLSARASCQLLNSLTVVLLVHQHSTQI